MDTVLYANEMNRRPETDKKMQFDYLQKSIRKNKRYSKWLKQESVENLDIIKQYYGYSDTKAKEVMDIISPDDIEYMRNKLNTGGVGK
tara:strand:- start:387 stop:650 length:264 start_codon:yes stop_codon:yes gene_type:complete